MQDVDAAVEDRGIRQATPRKIPIQLRLVFFAPRPHIRRVDLRQEIRRPRSSARQGRLLQTRKLDFIVGNTVVEYSIFVERSVMTTGTVKFFNLQKGFGFIAPDDGGNDAFVHISAVERAGMSSLREGQKVEFELVADRKSGKMAADNLTDLS